MLSRSILTLGVLILPIFGSSASAATCGAIFQHFPDQACAENSHGIAIANNQERAQNLLNLAEEGRPKFERAFGKPAPRYAIVENDIGALAAVQREAIRAHGGKAILPWLSAQGQQAKIEDRVKAAVEAQLAARGLDEAAKAAVIESALAQARAQTSASSIGARDLTAIPHELAHMWLIYSYWPDHGQGGEVHYGGPGPDWLDEMAAILAEPDTAKQRRRALFWDRYAKLVSPDAAGSIQTDDILDLQPFFAGAHPLAEKARQLSTGSSPATEKGGATITVLTGSAAREFAGDGIKFYLQSLMVSDYLAETSGNPQIFGAIAQAMADGQTFEAWLITDGSRFNLPTDIRRFENAWRAWLNDSRQPSSSAK